MSSTGTGTGGRSGATLLTDPDRAAAALSALGVSPDAVVVGYADNGGLYAALLRHLVRVQGHAGAGLLDGGLRPGPPSVQRSKPGRWPGRVRVDTTARCCPGVGGHRR